MSLDVPTEDQSEDGDPQNSSARGAEDNLPSLAHSRAYWSQVAADNDGMLGGFEEVTGPDLKESRRFISQVRRILRNNLSAQPPLDKIDRVVDCGAGIGRITKGLLVDVAETVDIVEPIAKFAAEVANSEYKASGRVDQIFVQGLEDWSPPANKKYGVIWNQWCLGHLTDEQLSQYLRRAARGLSGWNGEKGEKGWIMVKENLTGMEGPNVFDARDSTVTRSDQKFREIFAEAGLVVVKSAQQKEFPTGLYPVMMYALRPS